MTAAEAATSLPDEEELEPEQSNTLGVIAALDNGDLAEVQMILGNRRVKHAGVIRPGIKIPLQACTAAQKQAYETMLADNAGFDAIDAELIRLVPKKSNGQPARSWLRPANSDYFTIRPDDFRRPGDAHALLRQYADGDGRVRRFPVWFPKGELDLVIPHGYRGFSGGGFVRSSSSYTTDGALECRYLPQGVTKPDKSAYLTRPCPGLDDPRTCADYAAKRCAFGGMIRCTVPGVSGIGEVIIPTQSWNGLGESVANLKRVQEVFGRFHGLFQGRPFLEISKVKEQVRDADGKRQMQYIIVIEPAVDMLTLAAAREPSAVLARARSAMSLFQGPVAVPEEPPAAEEPPQAEEPPDLAPGEIDPAKEKVLNWLEGALKHYSLPREQVEALARQEFGAEEDTLELIRLDTLKELAAEVKTRTAKDLDEFKAYLNDLPPF